MKKKLNRFFWQDSEMLLLNLHGTYVELSGELHPLMGLIVSYFAVLSGPQYLQPEGQLASPHDKLQAPIIIFMVGGPGCGKGVQCARLADKYNFYHVAIGDLLREEASRATSKGKVIKDIMLKGALVPTVGRPPNIVIVFDCSTETMIQRLLIRSQMGERVDDHERIIRQRLETHYTLCEPVFTYYLQKSLLRNILAEEPPEVVFCKCCSVIDDVLKAAASQASTNNPT
ncbi:adenylate kinase isoenzyme 1-like isoform X7 [Hemicordylus capensis]|uniref:adenylate kinase isoenzyme 1-like isoform X7 n=1 Tax=Hemicordylus capensis TaxID=884348 RepID=UPI0023046AB8|nr:adenylate kinase isoenzyme 1-like isoform X7 [Hemicordylus capensis]